MLFGTGPRLALSTSFSEAIDGKELSRLEKEKKRTYILLLGCCRFVAYVECAL